MGIPSKGVYFLPFLLFLSHICSVITQSLVNVYWSPIVGQPQKDSSQAVAVPNGTGGAFIFHPSMTPGPVDVTSYDIGEWENTFCYPLSCSLSLNTVPSPPYFSAASQSITIGNYSSLFPLPAGAAVAQVSPEAFSLVRFKAYAFGGSIMSATGTVTSALNTWLGWDGANWIPISLGATSTCLSTGCNFPRMWASAVFVRNCDTGGNPCVLVMGGKSPGIPMSTTGLGIMRLQNLNSANPTLNFLITYQGAGSFPSPRHSMSSSSNPDGTIVFFFGGMFDDGNVNNDMFALNMKGWETSLDAVPAEMSQIITNSGPSFVTAKNFPCNTAKETTKYCPGLGCWGPSSRWNGFGAGTADFLDLAITGILVNSLRCDSYGSCMNLGHAYNAIDGNTNGNYCSGSVSRSNSAFSPLFFFFVVRVFVRCRKTTRPLRLYSPPL